MNASLNFRRLIVGVLLATVFAAVVACGQESTTSEDPPAPPEQEEVAVSLPAAPEFTLPSANKGTDISLSQFQGDQPVVLVFYRAYW